MASFSNYKSTIVAASNTAAGVSAGATIYSTRSSLPISGNTTGDQAYVTGNNRLYIWNGSGWYNVALLNVAPSIQSVLDSDGGTTPFSLSNEGAPTTITITAQDSDGDPVTYNYSADSNFSGLATISQVSNVFTITPLGEDSATTESGTITFTATDGINVASSGTQTFTLIFTVPLEGSIVFTDDFMDTVASTGTQPQTAGGDGASRQVYYSIAGVAEFTDWPTVAAAGSIGDFPASMGNHRFFNESTAGHSKGFIVNENPFSVSSGNGSMEFWIRYNNSYSTRQWVVTDKYAIGGTAYGLTWLRDSLTNASIYMDGVSAGNERTSTLTVGTWYHCYFAKVGANMYLYLDGTLESSWSIGTDMSDVIDKVVFMNSAQLDDGAAVSFAGIRFHKGDLIYATSGGSTITGVEEPV